MSKEKISYKKKTIRGRVLVALIVLCLIVLVVLGFRFIRGTIEIRPAIMTVTNHYPGCSAFTALKGYLYKRYYQRPLVIKYLGQCRMINQNEDGFQLWDTPIGQYWMPKGKNQDFWLSIILSEMDIQLYTKGNQTICPGDIVIDCGAYIGTFTRAALKAGAGLVVAIEMAPANLVCLKRNLSAEIASGKVIIYEKGVWDRDDYLDLNLSENPAADSLIIPREKGSIKVPLTTLDKIVKELRLQRVDFVKMDIEGSEENALKGAVKTLQQFKPKLSVAVYHKMDGLRRQYDVIPALIRQIRPDYQIDYGPTFIHERGFTFPAVMYFR